MYQAIARFLFRLFGRRYRYICTCGWHGNVCAWAMTRDERRPLCPQCFGRLK